MSNDVMPYEAWLKQCLIDENPTAHVRSEAKKNKKTIPASYIRDAILGNFNKEKIIHSGLRVFNFKIKGDLHLENLEVPFPLYLENCVFEGYLHIWRIKAKTLSLIGSIVKSGLDIRTAYIDGHLLLRNGFQCNGPFLARDITVTGSVDLKDAFFAYDGHSKVHVANAAKTAAGECFSFSRSRARSINWSSQKNKPKGIVCFRDAAVGSFNHRIGEQNWLEAWPDKGKLIIDGFKYKKFTSCSVKNALEWLELQSEIQPSSYASLAEAYKVEHSFGKMEDVLITAKKREINSLENPIRRNLNKLIYWSVGYGKSPGIAVTIFFGIAITHFLIITIAATQGYFQPTTNSFLLEPCFLGDQPPCSKDISSWKEAKILPSGEIRYLPPAYPAFNQLEYSFESFAPIFSFGQKPYWEPSLSGIKFLLSILPALAFFFGGVFVGAISGLISAKNVK